MVDYDSIFEEKRLATFYMKEGKVNILKEDDEFKDKFEISLPGRMGSEVRPWGRDWEPTMPDARVCL